MARPSLQAVCLVSASLAGASVILFVSTLLARRKRAVHCADQHYSAEAQSTADPDVSGLSDNNKNSNKQQQQQQKLQQQVPPPVPAAGSMPSCAERYLAIEFWIGRAFWHSIGEEASSEVTAHILNFLDEEAGARRALREAAAQVEVIVLQLARAVAAGKLQQQQEQQQQETARALASLSGARQHLEEITACMGDEFWLKARLGPIQMSISTFSALERQKLLLDIDADALPFPGQQLAEVAERLCTATAFVLSEVWEEDEAARMELMASSPARLSWLRTRRP
ncbi:unnamed protein product [Polarella glacialis]|uniref:Uncharacterized protein n=1 Tax=Polarella glacialis TaxID=89957 RepID=A0A813DAD7_POLGL|nr:unnamed protein product [Polarella glacialis]